MNLLADSVFDWAVEIGDHRIADNAIIIKDAIGSIKRRAAWKQ